MKAIPNQSTTAATYSALGVYKLRNTTSISNNAFNMKVDNDGNIKDGNYEESSGSFWVDQRSAGLGTEFPDMQYCTPYSVHLVDVTL